MKRIPTEFPQHLELWGGIECTVNRVGDHWFDQLEWNGHSRRLGDLELIAELGIRTLRYPILWERTAGNRPGDWNWSWADERQHRLRQLDIRPIIGLIHHGSGPSWTSLIDANFADGLADFAGNVARRYPWVDMWTPVNEPLTTARFSALYGHWYPHARNDLLFAQALLTECRAIVLSMLAIRREQPGALLVQTEDLGKTYSTPLLRYQAEFENDRRWLTFDLLCGRVDRHHPMGAFLLWCGVAQSDLLWFQDHPCPPDILGVNHYVTSERYLDERWERYPLEARGGNGRHVYADVDLAVAGVNECTTLGPEGLLNEAWQRYRRPLAVTEVHLNSTCEAQRNWLRRIWRAAELLRQDGADIRAVTAWALFGAYDWNCLVTRPHGFYESGAFDVSGGIPQPTPLSDLLRELSAASPSY
jgi:dTDP-4-dehydrorhamnose reductase